MNREQLIELIGKPIHDMRFNGDRYATSEIIMEVLTAIEAAGLCIVPREATGVMERAGWEVEELATPCRVYRAMIETGRL